MTIEFLQPDGSVYKFPAGAWNNSGSTVPAVKDSSSLHHAISLDFKVTILESAFEFIN